MIKILHLSYCDRKNGAGIAAKRIHSCICDYDDPNIKSFLRVNTYGVTNENIIYTLYYINVFCPQKKKGVDAVMLPLN